MFAGTINGNESTYLNRANGRKVTLIASRSGTFWTVDHIGRAMSHGSRRDAVSYVEEMLR
jgi:hypothetical protein